MLYILDRNEQVVGLLQSNSDRNKNIYYDDVLTEILSSGADTFTFTSIPDKETSRKLTVGNYIAFKKDNKFKLLQIIEVNENKEDVLTKEVYCEGAGLELINTVYSGSKMDAVNVERFLKNILQDTNWKVGHVSSNLTKTLSLDVKEKEVYSIIQEHLYDFEAEIDFRVEIKGNRIVGRYIDVYSKRGRNNGRRLEINRDIKGITRKVSLANYATKLIGEGKNGLNFRDISMTGAIEKPLGQNFVTNDEAYSRINNKGKHITRKFTYDTEDAYELLRQTHKALKEYSEPKVTYEVDVDILDFDDIEIGDYVSISDLSFTPPLLVTARISELETSKTNKYSNKAVLSNFNEVRSGISSIFPILGEDIVSGSIGEEQMNPDYVDSIISDSVNATMVKTEILLADKANIKDLDVTNANIDNLKANVAEIDELLAGNITAENIKADSITSDHIQANTIDTKHLKADIIDAEHINANSITSNHIQSNTIDARHINSNSINANHIQANTITSGHIQTGSITAGSGIIADGAIGNAQISQIDAGKIEAGTIDTSKVTIQGANGHLRLKGNRMQVFQGTGNQAKERVSVGDVNGDGTTYGLRVRGADGQTVLLDENGVTREGITDGSINNSKISDDANIDGTKLNINSVVSKINEDGTETIQGTKIEVDGTTLNTKLSTITTKQTEDSNRITQAQSQITANTNAIKLKVDEQTYTTDKKDMTAKLEKNTSEITAMKGEIALKVEQTDIENAINEATLSRADFIARNFLSTPLIVSDSTLPIYTLSGIPNPPIGSVFGGFSQERNIIKNNNISSNGSAWAIIVGYEFYKNTTDNDKKNKIRDIIKKVADFMANNVSIGRFNSMDFNFIDTNYKYDSTSKSWVKSNYKEIYISTLWLQVKAMVYAYEILKDNTYSSLCFNILDSLFNTHFYINAKVASNELPTHLEWSSYEYLACDNLSTNYRFVASTKQYANQMGYYIHQAIPDVIRVFGDNERPTPKGDIYKPSDILVGLKKYLKNAYDTQNITAKPLGLPYGYFHRVENESGGYDYIPQNWDFIEDTWGDVWFVGDVVTYIIYAFAASGLTDIAREYADNYYKLRVNVKDDKWSTRFNASELIFYDRMDFYTGSHLSDDNSISITYTALYYEILKQIGKNEHIDACCYTLAKHQINNLDNKNIDGGYPWDISRDDSSLEFKSFGEIINSQFYKNLNITSFTAIDNKFAEIKVTTDSISQNVTNLSQTVSTKADGSTVTTLSSKVSSLETSVNGISGKVTNLEKTTTDLGTSVEGVQGEVSTLKSDVASLEVTTSGISQKVSSVESTTATLDGKVTNQETRLSEAEQKITDKAITSVVQESQFIKDMDGKITTNTSNISKVEQTANSISSKVSDLSGKYTEIKQTVDSIDLTGKVSFSDLTTEGKTTINGANIDTTNLRVKGELISGQINGVGGIRFADGAVIASYDSHVTGYKGISVSAPDVKLGDKVNIYHPTMYYDVIGKNNTNSSTTTWTMSSAGALTCASASLSKTLNVNGVIYGMNNLALARGSIYIPSFGASYTYDFIRGGNSSIAFADSGPIHFIYNGTKSSFIAGGTVYLPHAGNVNCDHFRLGAGIMASPSSGSFHFLTASGGTSPLYAGVLYSATTLSLKEPMVMSNNSVFDKINSIDVIETKNGLRLHNPISNINAIDESPEVVKTVYNEEKDEIKTSIDYTSAISTLWKAVQELKQENDELKEKIKDIYSKL